MRIALYFGLALAGCAALPPATPAIGAAQALTTACNGFAQTIYTLAAYRAAGALTPVEDGTVSQLIVLVGPICEAPPADPSANVLSTVDDALAQLQAVALAHH